MDHDELIKEAEKLADGMKQGEMVKQAFIFSYVANAELRAVWQELKHLKWIICSVLVIFVLGIVANILVR